MSPITIHDSRWCVGATRRCVPSRLIFGGFDCAPVGGVVFESVRIDIANVEVRLRKRQNASEFDFDGTRREPTHLKLPTQIVERGIISDVKSEYVRPCCLSNDESHPAIGPFVAEK
jgi:hypothetical protein